MNHYYVLLFLIITVSSIAVGLFWQKASDYKAAALAASKGLADATEDIMALRKSVAIIRLARGTSIPPGLLERTAFGDE